MLYPLPMFVYFLIHHSSLLSLWHRRTSAQESFPVTGTGRPFSLSPEWLLSEFYYISRVIFFLSPMNYQFPPRVGGNLFLSILLGRRCDKVTELSGPSFSTMVWMFVSIPDSKVGILIPDGKVIGGDCSIIPGKPLRMLLVPLFKKSPIELIYHLYHVGT